MARTKQPTTNSTTTSKSSKAKTTETVSATSVVATPAPTTETAAPAPTTEGVAAPAESVATVFEQCSKFMTKLQGISASISALKTEFRGLERQVTKDLKAAAKVSQKRKKKAGNRAPSGFVKPTLISNELATFLGKASGTEMARTEVTRAINAYIRTNSLQDKDNGRKIIPDTKLKSLLKIKKGDELTYFNLQTYMSPHFAKASDKVQTASA